MAGRATGMVPLMFTNSSRKAKSPPEVQVQLSEAEMKWLKEVSWIREKRKELDNHQHDYVQRRKEASKQRVEELQQFEDEWKNREQFVSDDEAEVDQKHWANAENQVNSEEVEVELKKAEESIQVERDSLTAWITEFQ